MVEVIAPEGRNIGSPGCNPGLRGAPPTRPAEKREEAGKRPI